MDDLAIKLDRAQRELANARGEHFAYTDARSLVRYCLPYHRGEEKALAALDGCIARAKFRLDHAIAEYNKLRLLADNQQVRSLASL